MAINLSPGVNVSEIDLTTTVPGVATSIGAIAGAFQWGPVLEVRTISSEVELVDTFNKPNNDVADTFFSAANFLSYSNALRVVRNVGSAARNATNGASGISGLTIVTAGVSNAMAPGTFALTFTGGGGSGAQGTATLAYGATGVLVSAVSLTDAGTGYSTTPTVTVTGATGFTTVPVITASTANTILIKNEEDYQQNYISGVDSAAGTWTSKYPGVLGNSLKVSICDSTGFTGWTYASSFGIAPGTSTYASQNGGSLDELHIIVIDEDGKFTGTQNSVLEKFEFVSKASDAKTESGESNYYANVINNRSRYIWWTNHPRTTTDWGTTASSAGAYDAVPGGAITSSLTAGVDANVLSNGEIQAGYDLFADAETIDVNLIIGASANSTVGTYLVQSIAENRGDAVVFLSPTKVSVVDNKGQEVADITTFRNTLPSSSYAVVDSGWKYQYDKYNDVFRWVPLNADIAGLCARTDATNDPWFSPAGFNRGNLKNVVKLAFNPSKANRDDLFKIGINPVVTFPGQGTVLFGDKTLLSKPSAFDRINVRRLFNVLKKSISTASKFSLFELNDEFTRAQFVGLVEPFLRDVQGRRGITDFKVVCDTTNNTPQVIDSNSFVGDIYIKPARSINFIQLNFVAVRTGVEFSEIIGQF
jgi:phage tail sheath protein FI